MKETFYFPHDYHARHDPKCAALISDFGMAGYGLYWCIIEILHEQKEGKLEKFPKLFDGLSHTLRSTPEAVLKQIEAMVKQYNLLQEDEKYLWSERVLKNLKERKDKFKAKSEAGKLGGLMSGEARKTKQNEAVLEANELKERKGKENKGNKNKVKEIEKKLYLDCVRLTDDEYQKLIEKFGEAGFQEQIKNLNEYIMSKGKKYASHYHTILMWERKNNGQYGRRDSGNRQLFECEDGKEGKYANLPCTVINTDDPC